MILCHHGLPGKRYPALHPRNLRDTAPYQTEPPQWRQQPGTPQPALANGRDFSCHPHNAFPGLTPLEAGTAGEEEEINHPRLGATVALGAEEKKAELVKGGPEAKRASG